MVLDDAIVAPANVGPRTMPNYPKLQRQAIYNLAGGGKVFAGPVDDPFFVDLGGIFDLATIRKNLGRRRGPRRPVRLQRPLDLAARCPRPT